MKKIIGFILIATFLLGASSCKKFLNVDPIDDLSGNNYWKSKEDIERFTWNLYGRFKRKTMGSQNTGEGETRAFFFPATADLRLAPVRHVPASGVNRWRYVDPLRSNAINLLLSETFNGEYYNFYQLQSINNWEEFYNIIALSNILYYNIDNMDEGVISPSEADAYRAEAVFMRNLSYFFLIRMFKDVPYYTNAFNNEPLPRTDMLTVLENCIADLKEHYQYLPWTFDDTSVIGVRAMRGGAIALLMHMNAWAAAFSPDGDKNALLEQVDLLGAELMEENRGAYLLYPIEEFNTIFKGKSKESLFELAQSVNYGERFSGSAQLANQFLRAPYKPATAQYTNTTSLLYYEKQFLDKLYPEGVVDKRRLLWFVADNFYNTAGQFVFLKYTNFLPAGSGQSNTNPDDSQIVFRYSDAILLRAEALAELGREEEARTNVNIVRNRAGAEPITSGGADLKYDIFAERCRELMGEGHYFYDLVRTRRAVDRNFIPEAMSIEDFNNGAWTWPVHRSARAQNPHMRLNGFWDQQF